jgi:hypothetical protein
MPETKKNRRKSKIKIKEFLVNKLGGCCRECKEDDIIVLQFDHIKDDGYKDKIFGNIRKNRTIYHYYGIYNADQKLFFSMFQILCANCNVRKEMKRRSSGL